MNRLKILLFGAGLLSPLAIATATEAQETQSPVNPMQVTNEAIAQAPSDFGDAWESVACAEFNLIPIVAALTDCGYVTVPERHSQPDGPTIQVAVARTHSIGDSPDPDPLLMETGGPGQSTIGDILTLLPDHPVLLRALEQRDLVFVEQRGTQYSRPFLGCPEETDYNIADAKGEAASDDIAWMVACRDRLLAEGVNLNAFNTVENAADIYTVAELLGYDQFNYYGTSYGTLLGQYVMEQAEEHNAQLRSVILDGVVTPTIDFNLAVSHTMSGALRNLFAACAEDPQCNAAYPDLETVFLSLVDQLEQEPVPITLTVPETEETIDTTLDHVDLLLTFEPFLASSDASSFLPYLIDQAAEGNFRENIKILSGGLGESTSAEGMYHAIRCSRANSIQAEPAALFPEPYPQLAFLGPEAEIGLSQICDLLQMELEEPFINDNTDIPTLLLNGSYDPITPRAYSQAVAANLETAYVYTFPGVGHGSLFALPGTPPEQCVTAIMTDFLSEPEQTPDSRCLADLKPTFTVP